MAANSYQDRGLFVNMRRAIILWKLELVMMQGSLLFISLIVIFFIGNSELN